jgi:Polysaccharide biosynthesis protein
MIEHEGPIDRAPPERLAAATGSALWWRAAQHVGVRVISLVKFLVLARILAPEDFGISVIAAIAVALLYLVTDLGMVAARADAAKAFPALMARLRLASAPARGDDVGEGRTG